ncbi:MAG TPA: peptidoglycan-binding protein [Syntrophomonadaceae bacterium]|nr:peptidoglycan-binding protein [Syntrophomonadaceae bacterium]
MIYASRFLRLTNPFQEGPDVLALQEYLQSQAYYNGSLNGILDAQTHQALVAFQTAHHLQSKGIVDPDTWIALHKGLASSPTDIAVEAAGTHITIDINLHRLYFTSPVLQKDYPVAVGKPSTPSPLGNWTIVQKALNPGGPFGTRWMRLSVPWGGYGIHGTNNPASIGHSRSHGCIRMYNQDVEEIYPLSPLGTPVAIVGKTSTGRVLQTGSRGRDVTNMQVILKKLGYYRGRSDGRFALLTQQAVTRFQTDQGLQADGMSGPRTWLALVKVLDLSRGDLAP